MDIKSEVIRIVNKAMGKKSFLDVYFFDTKVISSLKQIDYIQKTYEFKSSPLEFLEISSFSKLYETTKKYSTGFNESYDSFRNAFFNKFVLDVLRNVNFKKDEAALIINNFKSAGSYNFNLPPNAFSDDNNSYSKIFSEILKALKSSTPKTKFIESEIMATLNRQIYESDPDSLLNKSISLIDAAPQIKKAIQFLAALENLLKIKINYAEISNGDIRTNIFKLLSEQRPDFQYSKVSIEQEIMAVGAKIFNASNLILMLDVINGIESKYNVSISKDESFFSGSFDNFVKIIAQNIHSQRPELTATPEELELDVMTYASSSMAKCTDGSIKPQDFGPDKAELSKGFSKTPKLSREIENKFIDEIEKIFRINFSVFDLMEITGLESIVKIVDRLIKSKKIHEKYPGFLPKGQSELNLYIRRELIRISGELFGDEILSGPENDFIKEIEKKFMINFNVFDLMEIKGLESIIQIVERLIKSQKVHEKHPGLLPADQSELSLYIRRETISTSGNHLGNEILSMSSENKFINEIEKKFMVNFKVFDLMEITGLESIIKIIERLIKDQKICESHPGLFPANGPELTHHIRRELIRISRNNMVMDNNMLSMGMDGLDFPRKLDSMLAVEVIVQIEKHFQLKIPEEKLYSISSIDDMTALVTRLLEEKKKSRAENIADPDIKNRLIEENPKTESKKVPDPDTKKIPL